MHDSDPRLTHIYMRKDSLLQSMHEAAAKHGTRSIFSISFRWQTKLGFNFVEPLWYGRSWPRSQSERGKSNLEWKKNTFILSNYNELVDFLSSGMETPWSGRETRMTNMLPKILTWIMMSWITDSSFRVLPFSVTRRRGMPRSWRLHHGVSIPELKMSTNSL